MTPHTAPARCATIGHRTRPATHVISYRFRGEPATEQVCAGCAESYGRRPALVDFTATPIGQADTAPDYPAIARCLLDEGWQVATARYGEGLVRAAMLPGKDGE